MKKGGTFVMDKKNLRRVSYLVTSQTDYNIKKLSKKWNKNPGEIVDSLVKNCMLKMRSDKNGKFY